MTPPETNALTDDDPPPSVWDHLSTLDEELAGIERLLFCVDFDGTLAPIVDDPTEAAMTPDVEDALRQVVNRSSVDAAIVSGRSLSDLRTRVDISPLILVGNHGLEIEWGDAEWHHPDVDAYRATLDEVCEALEQRFVGISGVFLENKGLTATIHYRRAPSDAEEQVRTIVEAEVSNVDDVIVSRGDQIFEIRPAIDWDKGKALGKLMDEIDADRTVYIGDDVTDEDAFRELAGTDHIGVTVGDEPSVAAYRLRHPAEVRRFLSHLAEVDLGTRT